MLNHQFWAQFFRTEFNSQLSAIVAALENRLLPAFEGIEEEAEAATKEAWDGFMSQPSTGDEDPGNFVEVAQDAGVAHYILITGIRQGMLNLFAAALYHTFEQQIMLFHRREVLNLAEENDTKLFNLQEFIQRLDNVGIDIKSFDTWPMIDELRCVANTVKHGEGQSAKKLHDIRPDLFESPSLIELGVSFRSQTSARVFQPLIGEDLLVRIHDIEIYKKSLIRFWDELSVTMKDIA